MKFKQFIKVAAMSVLAVAITACSKDPDSAFQNNLDLGYYDGMPIKWVKDDASTAGIGFYVVDNVNVDKKQKNNEDFEDEKLVGQQGDLKIMWVRDHTSAKSRGFYLFRDKDNNVVPSLTLAQRFSNGKSSTVKSVGTVFTSNINHLQVQLDDKEYEETVRVSELSSSELVQLSTRLLEVAKQKELENNNTVTTKPRF